MSLYHASFAFSRSHAETINRITAGSMITSLRHNETRDQHHLTEVLWFPKSRWDSVVARIELTKFDSRQGWDNSNCILIVFQCHPYSLIEVRLASRCQASVPHPAVWVNVPGRFNYFCDREVDIMCVAYTGCNATEPSKCTVYLNIKQLQFSRENQHCTSNIHW